MHFLVFGKDTFRSKKHLKNLIEQFRKIRDATGMNVIKIDCEKIKDDSSIIREIFSVAFLAEKKMIILENLLKASKKDELREIISEKITQNKMPNADENVVIFWEEGDKFATKSAKKLFDLLKKEPYSREFSELKTAELADWIFTEIVERGGTMNKKNCFYLTSRVGGDIWLANSLIEQLIFYADGKEISADDINLFTENVVDDNIFNLVDAILGGQKQKAYEMMRKQYKIGEDAQFIFAMILRQCRIFVEIKDLMARNAGQNNQTDLAKQLGLHPFVIKKSLTAVNKFSFEKLSRIYQDLLEIDIKTKTGRGDQSMLLDFFVAKL